MRFSRWPPVTVNLLASAATSILFAFFTNFFYSEFPKKKKRPKPNNGLFVAVITAPNFIYRITVNRTYVRHFPHNKPVYNTNIRKPNYKTVKKKKKPT